MFEISGQRVGVVGRRGKTVGNFFRKDAFDHAFIFRREFVAKMVEQFETIVRGRIVGGSYHDPEASLLKSHCESEGGGGGCGGRPKGKKGWLIAPGPEPLRDHLLGEWGVGSGPRWDGTRPEESSPRRTLGAPKGGCCPADAWSGGADL